MSSVSTLVQGIWTTGDTEDTGEFHPAQIRNQKAKILENQKLLNLDHVFRRGPDFRSALDHLAGKIVEVAGVG